MSLFDFRTRGGLDYWAVEDTRFLVSVSCLWEATARKVGNVHRYQDFPATSYLDFAVSGCAAASALGTYHRVGRDIWHAVTRSLHVTGTNTNLGIVLLLAPLVQVGGFHCFTIPELLTFDLKIGLPEVLAGLTTDDAEQVYDAIRLAAPGGLGAAPKQDIREQPTVTLLEAMKLAADRDLIARQYANGYADVFDFGVPTFEAGFEVYGCVEAAVVNLQLEWLAEYPDSLIARKNGPAVADEVRWMARDVLALGGLATPEGRAAGVALDRHLRSDGNKLNPGTTADLVTACLFVALREGKVTPSAPFRWDVPDWL